ncbi:hypothetical protein DRQ25_16990 [Candidatus Fermentibacteria bacterium]|nr:MAG: hypothetical protein DRQ25_16990 [Candidatus Fermentibacteria bacterium]
MKSICVLLLLPLLAFGWIDDHGVDSSIPAGTPPVGEDAITLTAVNTFNVPSASHILGLNMQYTSSSSFGMMDNGDDKLRGINGNTGAEYWNVDINYGGSMFNFGLCHSWPSPYGWYINAWSDSDMHYRNTSGTWSVPFANPAGTNGRGMSFEVPDDHIWETYSQSTTFRIYRISTSGSSEYWSTPEVSGQMSGLATFQHGGNTWVAVTCYYDATLYFYEYTGSALNYIGTASTGISGQNLICGLTYSDARDSFFLSYEMPSNWWVAEFDYSITALERDTWGSIKTQF